MTIYAMGHNLHLPHLDVALSIWSVTMPELPETVTTFMEDGCVAISVGDLTGVVSSAHLIAPKEHQLQKAWLDRKAETTDAR